MRQNRDREHRGRDSRCDAVRALSGFVWRLRPTSRSACMAGLFVDTSTPGLFWPRDAVVSGAEDYRGWSLYGFQQAPKVQRRPARVRRLTSTRACGERIGGEIAADRGWSGSGSYCLSLTPRWHVTPAKAVGARGHLCARLPPLGLAESGTRIRQSAEPATTLRASPETNFRVRTEDKFRGSPVVRRPV